MNIYLNQFNTATDRNLLPLSAGLIRSFAINDPFLADCSIEIEMLFEGGIGCQVTLSMQSFDDETLTAIKRTNIHLDTFRSLKAEYNRRNIPTYSELP